MISQHGDLSPSLWFLQAFGQAYSNQRKVAEDGETNEETLLQESASKEAYYKNCLLELQMDLDLSRSVASNTQAESEHLNLLLQDLREVSLPQNDPKMEISLQGFFFK